MLKGSAYFLPFSSLIQTIKLNRYNDREEIQFFFHIPLKICYIMMMKTIREYLNTKLDRSTYTTKKKHISFNWCHKSIESTSMVICE